MIHTKQEIIQNIKDCGQSLIDNAENIANYYKYMTGIRITCYVNEYNELHILTLIQILFQKILLKDIK